MDIPFDGSFLYALACANNHTCVRCLTPLVAELSPDKLRVVYNWKWTQNQCLCLTCLHPATPVRLPDPETSPQQSNPEQPLVSFETDHAFHVILSLGDCTMCKINSNNLSHAHAGFRAKTTLKDTQETFTVAIEDAGSGKKDLTFKITDANNICFESVNQANDAVKALSKKHTLPKGMKGVELLGIDVSFPTHRLLVNEHRMQALNSRNGI